MTDRVTFIALMVLLVSARIADTEGVGHRLPPAEWEHDRALLVGARLPINTASASALESVPGIGPTLARRIVQHRRDHGMFHTRDDLLNVSGIGPATRDRVAPFLSWRTRMHTKTTLPYDALRGAQP